MLWIARTAAFAAKAGGAGVSGLGMTTAANDLSEFLRSAADWVEAGGSIEIVLWAITIVFAGWAAIDVAKWVRGLRRKRKPTAEKMVEYAEACEIASRYIDPDRTMPAGVRITVRSQFLAKFELVVGAKKGDLYDGALLHQWFQKNAARALVNHQNEIT